MFEIISRRGSAESTARSLARLEALRSAPPQQMPRARPLAMAGRACGVRAGWLPDEELFDGLRRSRSADAAGTAASDPASADLDPASDAGADPASDAGAASDVGAGADAGVRPAPAMAAPPPPSVRGVALPTAGPGLGRLGRWLPPWLAEARVDPGRSAAAALGAVALVAAAVVGVLVWHARPQPEPVTVPAARSGGQGYGAGPAAANGAAAGSPTGDGPTPAVAASGAARRIVVAVTGKVRHPGVVSLPDGARVVDALRAAGGPLPGTDLVLLNLARRLTDGELVVVGMPNLTGASGPASTGGPAGPTGGSGPASPVDLNTATLDQLDGLPGVGPVLAQRILDWRVAHGEFTSVDQLQEVDGIGDSKFAQLRELVRV